MWALDQPDVPRARPLLADTPIALLAALAVGVVVALALLPDRLVGVAGVAAGHGGLLGTALAWALGPGPALRPAGVAVALLALAAGAAALHPAGGLAYLCVPLWVLSLGRGGALASLALGPAPTLPALLAGLSAGAFLGGHLLVSASRSLGYRVGEGALDTWLGALAYDAGANVLSAEVFFRGALFNRAQRRWSFGLALGLSTAATVARYLVDPLLPKTVELVIGAVFYVTLLAATNCWLVWWSGSLVPAVLSALVFFAAYRLLGVR